MDKILDRIRKLLALSQSSNPNEAALALEKALELMKEHKLNDVDLIKSTILTKNSHASYTQRLPQYIINLADLVANVFSCEFYISTSMNYKLDGRSYKTNIVFVGFSPNHDLSTYTFNNLLPKLKKARNDFRSRSRLRNRILADKDIYAEGWVLGIYSRLFHLIPTKQFIEKYSGIGLVKINPLKEYIEAITNGQALTINREGKEKYRNLGYSDGLLVDIHKPLNANIRGQLTN